LSKVRELTGLPSLPKWVFRIFLRFPSLVPYRLRWKVASKGIGLIVNNLDGNSEAPKVMRNLGLKQGQAISSELGFGQTLKEVMQVTVLANSLFGTKSQIFNLNDNKGQTKITKCAWAGSSWGERPCALLSSYEIGLVEGLNPKIKTKFLKRISKGDEYCLTEYKMQ
jgi:hypothetical protein